MKDFIYNWKAPKITSWRRLLRIVFLHGWQDHINCRGYTAIELATIIKEKHEKDLKPEELAFVNEVLK